MSKNKKKKSRDSDNNVIITCAICMPRRGFMLSSTNVGYTDKSRNNARTSVVFLSSILTTESSTL